jgi:hypothetical protein
MLTMLTASTFPILVFLLFAISDSLCVSARQLSTKPEQDQAFIGTTLFEPPIL